MECRIGRVTAIRPTEVDVELLQLSACASCHARGACTTADMRMHQVTITKDLPVGLSVGDRVQIIADNPKVLQASVYAYIIPLMLIVLEAVLLPKLLGLTEIALVAVILGTIVLYGGVLWVLRDHFKRTFTFRIRSLEPKAQS